MPDHQDNKNSGTDITASSDTNRDNHLWLKSWRSRETDFHQTTVNSLLSRFWPSLGLAPGSRIFVPLCGKSLDMRWLADQGYRVIGIELSPIAVRTFFQENGLHPVKRRQGRFTVWQDGNIEILCGDYFSLTRDLLGPIDTVYDRAALTALPADIRRLYVAKLGTLLPETAHIFLLTAEVAEEHETEQQALGVDEEINRLYAERYSIDLTHVDCVFESDPQSPKRPMQVAYKLYRLAGRPSASGMEE